MNDEQKRFAAEANVAVLASVDGKGRPHATPIWYLFDDGEFVLSVGRGGQKHRNLERNPEVTLVIDSRVVPYYALMVSGTMEIGPQLSDEQRLAMATRYLGDDLGKRYVEFTKGEDSVGLRLKPRKVMEFSGRAGRTVR
ncbi:MAG TPA: pyridoxamine 5'-phosphate oxidase family protein [Dehalococcoidia bacterium]